MKTLLLTLGLMAACVRAGYAVEYVTLGPGEEVSVAPSSLVEFVSGIPVDIQLNSRLLVTWSKEYPQLGSSGGYAVTSSTMERRMFQLMGAKLTGLVKISNIEPPTTHQWLTLRITPANELNVVAPTSMLVIPENSTGNYNIVVETSSDTATWTPFHSQTVSANDAKRFFRTRIVKAE